MWKRLLLAIIVATASLAWFVPVYGSDTADVTVTATPIPTEISNFRATYIGPQQVELTWTKGGTTNNTMIRGKFWEYPTSRTDGYQVYYGQEASSNDTAIDFDITLGTIYYRAYSENGTGSWAANYASAELENPAMTALVAQITQAGTFLIIAVLLLIVFWQKSLFLYALACPLSFIFGLSLAKSATNGSALWVAGIVIAIIGTYCLYKVVLAGLEGMKVRRTK